MDLTFAGQRRHPVLLAGPFFAEVLARLDAFFEVEQAESVDLLDRAALAARLAGKSGLLATRTARIDAEMLAKLPHLKTVIGKRPLTRRPAPGDPTTPPGTQPTYLSRAT